jgi:hypothetical protein
VGVLCVTVCSSCLEEGLAVPPISVFEAVDRVLRHAVHTGKELG